jgi:hypothetical protein
MNLDSAGSLVVRRYGEEQLRTQEARVRRGFPGFRPASVTGPGFGAYLRGLLPTEQTMSAVTRTLTASAAEQLARDGGAVTPASARLLPLAAEESPVTAGAAPARLPTAEWSAPPSASQLLGLAQRALGVPVDSGLAAGIRLAGGEPLNAQPIRSAPYRLLVEARSAYLRTNLPTTLALAIT